jgi:beta-glucanase (GH16 family)
VQTKLFQSGARTGRKRGLCHSVAYLLALSTLWLILIPQAAAQNWQLVWSDEFNGPAGSAPSSADWSFMLGKNNANGELEFYCPPGNNTAPCNASTPNIFEDGKGNLIIRAIRTPSGTWTSGRMNTSGKHTFQFGRMEARMKLVPGAGFWPAFWMLGSNIGSVGWPTCGEQDIMEWVPHYTPTTTSSTIHGPGYSGANGIGSRFTFPNGGRIDDAAYHTYGVIWSQDKMEFYRDDWTKPFFTVTSSNIPAGTQWVFNHPFFLLLNFAIGGGFPGPPDASSPSPADVLVDYVRVYQPCTSCTQAVAINAGGPAVPPFDADRDFAGGSTSTHAVTIDRSGVTNPAPLQVYQSIRFGNFSYTIPGFTVGSNHTVRLHFAETFWTTTGQRVFHVSINGASVLTNFDIIAAAGATHRAIVKEFPTTADSAGNIVIQFVSIVDHAAINGIEIQ